MVKPTKPGSLGAFSRESRASAPVAVRAPQALRVPQALWGLGRPRFTAKSGFQNEGLHSLCILCIRGAKVEDTDTENLLRCSLVVPLLSLQRVFSFKCPKTSCPAVGLVRARKVPYPCKSNGLSRKKPLKNMRCSAKLRSGNRRKLWTAFQSPSIHTKRRRSVTGQARDCTRKFTQKLDAVKIKSTCGP